MTFTEAAAQVLRLVGKPLHYKEITDVAIEKDLLSHVGKSPEVTMGARLAAVVKKNEKGNPLVRVKPGVFALQEWDQQMIDQGLADRTPALERLAELEAGQGGSSETQVEQETTATASEQTGENNNYRALLDDEQAINERERAWFEMAASATNVFAEEEDDDKPILADEPEETEEKQEPSLGKRRRRRRRRGTGRVNEDDGLPSYTISDAPQDSAQLALLVEKVEPSVHRPASSKGPGRRDETRRDEGQAHVRRDDARRDETRRDEGQAHVRRDDARRDETRRDEGQAHVRRDDARRDDARRDEGQAHARRDDGRRDEGRYEGRREEGQSYARRDEGRREEGPSHARRDEGRRDESRRDEGRRDESRRDEGRRDEGGLEHELPGDLVEIVFGLLREQRQGASGLKQVVEQIQRKRRDLEHLSPGAIAAACRSENARRSVQGFRPRFRLVNGKVGLSEWASDPDGLQTEEALESLLGKYAQVAERQLGRRLRDLPPRALCELIKAALEASGYTELQPVRRHGPHSSEQHWSGRAPDISGHATVAIVMRKDGRDLGRERVIDLRGALHHYGPAQAGLLVTTGQVLSGAREEAQISWLRPSLSSTTLAWLVFVSSMASEYNAFSSACRRSTSSSSKLCVADGEPTVDEALAASFPAIRATFAVMRTFRLMRGHAARLGARSLIAAGLVLLSSCAHPPASQFPTAADAISRMRATYACSRGLVGEARLDYYGSGGRVRGEARYLILRPDRLRVDVISPFGTPLSTVASDGHEFALLDVKERVLLRGPAKTCNLMRFIQLPVPPHALLRLLSGEAPVLAHDPGQATIRWTHGHYLVNIDGQHQAKERIELEPHPQDWGKPWPEQRVRVRRVELNQAGYVLYEADFDGHRAAETAGPRVDDAGLEPDIAPSGPECSAEVPRRVRFVIDDGAQDLSFIHENVQHNPPIATGVFAIADPGGLALRFVDCPDEPGSESRSP